MTNNNHLFIIKILFTLFLCILVPTYWQHYGPENFLWLSDIGLFVTLIGLWWKSPLIMSILMVAILPLEIMWNIDFFTRLFTGFTPFGIVHYMFNPERPLFIKALSFFHLVVPIIWIRYTLKWGYKKNAFKYAVGLFWITVPLTYLLTTPPNNINWVFTPIVLNWTWLPFWVWVLLLMIGTPLLMYWPLHKLYQRTLTQKN